MQQSSQNQDLISKYHKEIKFCQQQAIFQQKQVEFCQQQIQFYQEQISLQQRVVKDYKLQIDSAEQQMQDLHSHMQMLQEQTLQQQLTTYSDVYLRVVQFYMFFIRDAEYQNAYAINSYFESACNVISPALYQPYMLQELPDYVDRIRASYDLDDNEELVLFNEYTVLLHQIQDTVSSYEDESAVRQYAVAMYVFFRAACDFTDEEQRLPEEMLETIRGFRSEQNMTQILQQQIQQNDVQLLPIEPQQQLIMLQQLEPSYQQEVSSKQQKLSEDQQQLSEYQQRLSEYQQELSERRERVSQFQQRLSEYQQEQEIILQQQALQQQEGDANQDEIPVQCGFAADIENISDHNSIHDEI
ncbi:hypothetical protein Fsol_00583 [Candidatus Fokinia solitaria]|uniref:Uncharacterized protein n=1 Tax=Candidatus Fokinia solitaria TaxID=1802984 RepID=A0A2U8BSX1_9RICK|nr:hypothetical protein [Candidatus Fokinia solitaria]AWD33370.1 hypothetical protein Fsol_00583 [Candidatus Fokinia solitaria]